MRVNKLLARAGVGEFVSLLCTVSTNCVVQHHDDK
jgi:hypothetical protein